MAIAGFSLTVTRNDISPRLAALLAAARHPRPVLQAMGTTFKSITEGTFNSVGASYRPKPWAPRKDPPGPSNLQSRNPTLSKSFHLEVTDAHARLSTSRIYAAIHQFGGTITAKGGRRLSWVDSTGRRIFAMKVVIPPRPFFPIDASGKLTPKAEEKIARAGERALAREAGI